MYEAVNNTHDLDEEQKEALRLALDHYIFDSDHTSRFDVLSAVTGLNLTMVRGRTSFCR